MKTSTTICILFLLVSGALACDDGCDSCENDCCWKKCFNNPPSTTYSKYYANIRYIINRIVEYRKSLGAGGTTFSIDGSTTSPWTYNYGKNLASMLAMALPVCDEFNPWCLNYYYRNWGYYSWSWPCGDRCKAAFSTIPRSGTRQSDDSPNWYRAGCILSNHCQANGNYFKCMMNLNVETSQRLHIYIANSPIWGGVASCSAAKRASVGIRTWNPGYCSYSNSGVCINWHSPSYMSTSTLSYYASAYILRCMRTNCCNNKKFSIGRRKRQTQAEAFSGVNSKTLKVISKKTTLAQFIKEVGGVEGCTGKDCLTPTPK